MAPRWPNIGPTWLQDGPRRPNIGPRWPQDGPTWAQHGPKMAQHRPNMDPRSPNITPRWLNLAPAMTQVSDTHLLAALCARQPKGLLWWGNFQPRFLARLGRENAYVLLQSSYPSKPSIQPRTNTVAPNHSRTFCPQKPIVPGVPHLLVDHLQHLGLCFYQFLRLGIIHVFQRRCTDPKVLVWLRAPNQRVETIPVGQSPRFHTGSVVV